METTLNKIIKAASLKLFNMFLGIFIFFLLTPYMIQALGDYYYGLWILLNTVLSYFALSEFGLSSAVERELAYALGQKNIKEFNLVFFNGFILFGIVSLIIIFLSLITSAAVIFIFPKISFLPLLLLLMGLTIAFDLSTQPFYAVLNAHLDFKINYLIGIVNTLLQGGLMYAFLRLGYKLFGLVLVNFMVMLFVKILQLLMINTHIKKLDFFHQKINRKTINRLILFGSKSFLVKIADLLRSRVDAFVIGASISVQKVTTYSIGTNLTAKANTFLNSLMEMLSPVFYQLVGANHQKRLQKTYFFSWKIALLISSLALAIILMLGYPFIKVWVGPAYLDGYIPLVILAIAAFLEKTQSPGNTIFFSYNQQHIYGILVFLDGIINLTLSLFFVFVLHLGLSGVALGTLTASFITKTITQPFFIAKLLKVPYWKYHAFFLEHFTKGILIYLSGYLFLIRYLAIANYLNLLYCTLIIIGLSLIHCSVVLSAQEIKILIQEITYIAKRIVPFEDE